MRIPLKADYAVRALVSLASVRHPEWGKAESIAQSEGISVRFLLNILAELKVAGLVESQRGKDGGYRLAREASAISIADVMRVVDGPLARVGDLRPEQLSYPDSTQALQQVWVALRTSVRQVLENVTVADVRDGALPADVVALVEGDRGPGWA
ncbi:MAG: Rrf2 family transcriptional regulator [Frankiales bacterium]|nr:Rrf2 family transcriptional regulator [Frankiales bacterium]